MILYIVAQQNKQQEMETSLNYGENIDIYQFTQLENWENKALLMIIIPFHFFLYT